MSLDADFIVDRRRMRRKLTFWRVFAVLFAICAVVAAGVAVGGSSSGVLAGTTGASIARVTITGLIRTDRQRVEALLQQLKTARFVLGRMRERVIRSLTHSHDHKPRHFPRPAVPRPVDS